MIRYIEAVAGLSPFAMIAMCVSGALPLRSTGAPRQRVHQFALRMRLLAPFMARKNMEKVKVSTVACPTRTLSQMGHLSIWELRGFAIICLKPPTRLEPLSL